MLTRLIIYTGCEKQLNARRFHTDAGKNSLSQNIFSHHLADESDGMLVICRQSDAG